MGQHQNQTQKNFPSLNREILKPIPPTTARKPASVQDHKTYFQSLWDDSENFLGPVEVFYRGSLRMRLGNQAKIDQLLRLFFRAG